MAIVSNNEFRDMATQANFPFTGDSTLVQDDLEIDTGCFIDALLYPITNQTAPYYVSKLNGNYGADNELEVIIFDNNTSEVCRVICNTDIDTAMATDVHGSVVGVLVYNLDLMGQLIGKVGRGEIELLQTVATFSAGVCFATEADGNLFIKTATDSYTDTVTIAAAGGVHFEVEPPTPPIESSSDSSGVDAHSSSETSVSSSDEPTDISINIYGELFTLNQPIVTINEREMSHAWVAAHPSAAVRVQTDTDEKLIIGKSKDFGSAN